MNLTPILQAGILLISAILTTFLIPYLKRKLSAEDMKTLQIWVEIGVTAAEQLYGSELCDTKKQWVMNFLESNGFVIDPSLDSLIEAEVLKLHRELYGEWHDGT